MRSVLVWLLIASSDHVAAQSLRLETVDDYVFPAEHLDAGPAFGAFVVYKDELYFTATTGVDPEGGSTYGLFKTDGETLTAFPVDPGFHVGTQFVEFQDNLYFRGDDGSGTELFRTDGVELTKYDLTPSNEWGSAPRNFEIVGDRLYFAANPGGDGRAALMMVRDDAVSVVADVDVDSSYPWHVAVGDDLYFTGGGPNGYELYRHDGNTVDLVLDAYPGPPSSDPWPQAVWNGELVFTAIGPEGRGLYLTDNGSARQLPISEDTDNYGGPNDFFASGDHLYFSAKGNGGYELYRTDGQGVEEYDLLPGPEGSSPQTYFANVLAGKLLVTGVGPEGPAVYVLSPDGQLTGTLNLGLGVDAFFHGYLREFDGEAYFRAGTTTRRGGLTDQHPRLFRTDGETVTEVPIALRGDEGVYFALESAVEHDGVLFLAAGSRSGGELVAINGELATVVDVFPGRGAGPRDIQPLGDELIFVARGESGDALYQLDDSSVSLIAELSPNTYVDSPGVLREAPSISRIARLGDQLLFLANTPSGFQLHRIVTAPEPNAVALFLSGFFFGVLRRSGR